MMKLSIAFALALAPAAAMQPLSSTLSLDAIELLATEHFEHFVAKFEKVYESLEHRNAAYVTYLQNIEEITAKNAELRRQGDDPVHGITKFADWTRDEFLELFKPHSDEALPAASVALPRKSAEGIKMHDWREQNVVTPVKDQGQCGSCWAHSAVETLESAFAMAGHDLTSLSVQQVVSCDNGNGDMGCQGGWYYTAWDDYMEASHGLTTESEYPYDDSTAHGSASKCDTGKAKDVVAGTAPTNFTWATTPCEKYFCKNQDEETLKANLLSYGPISVACDASEWSMYKGGVVTSSTCKNSGIKLDHAIQLVGFNEDAEVPYWIVRNSWNTNWGNDGYIYLKMGENTCGIADMPAMVTVEPVETPNPIA